MAEDRIGERNAPGYRPAATTSHADSREASGKDHFLQLMFFQASHARAHSRSEPAHASLTGSYYPLRHSKARAGERHVLPLPGSAAPVQLDSPATAVMTDLRQVSAVCIDRNASIASANRLMIGRGVRALFVVGDARQIFGIITATDILGERPIQFAQARNIHYDDVAVGDLMTPAERLEVLDLQDVLRARVGDIVATLKLAGRQHALVDEATEGASVGHRTVRGIFSLAQIARQLGIPAQQVHDIARTFAEIEAAIAS
jgi:CBS domain-containing protein